MLCLLIAAVAAAPSWAKERQSRSHKATAQFVREHPCPSTGATRGSCPGHVIDHVTPLCAGGADDPSNMQWQTVADAKAKDRLEREQCRKARTT